MGKQPPSPSPAPFPLHYYYDGWGPFLRGGSTRELTESIDILADSHVSTVLLSPNIGQSVSYPSSVSELCHSRVSDSATNARIEAGMGPHFARVTRDISDLWRVHEVDSLDLLTRRVLHHGLHAYASIRLNDVHMLGLESGQGPYTDPFYRDHPQWRLPPFQEEGRHGGGGLNFAVPEVRQHRLALIEELLRRYPFTGVELDFVRGPPFFPSDFPDLPTDLQARWPHFPRDYSESGIAHMNTFVKDVRSFTLSLGRELGRPIALGVRVPSTLSGCRRVGLDPVSWHQSGCLDFLTIARFLQIYSNLPISDFRKALPGLPIRSCVEHIVSATEHQGYRYPRDGTPEIFRGVAAAAYSMGASGLTLYNWFVTLGRSPTPGGKDLRHPEPRQLFSELGNPDTLDPLPKLYRVDSTFPNFDLRFWDSHAPLPAGATPDSPLLLTLRVAEKRKGRKSFRLRVEFGGSVPPQSFLQVNGYGQGLGEPAQTPHLFREPYDSSPPDPARCRDWQVDPKSLHHSKNEVAVMVSAPARILNVELAVQPEDT